MKTAIAVKPALLKSIDLMAKQRSLSRSHFINDVLQRIVDAKRDADITAKTHQLFATPASRQTQRAESEVYDALGTRWDDEKW